MKFLLLIGAQVRSQLRWAKEHVYSWLILGPLILGITYATASRLAEDISALRPSFFLVAATAAFSVICLIGLSLSRASAEIYHIRRPESFFDSLPISASTYLNVALVTRLSRTVIAALVILVARWLLGASEFLDRASIIPLILFTLIVTLAEVLAALNWIHWNHTKDIYPALLTVLILAVTVTSAGFLLVYIFKPDGSGSQSRFWVLAGSAAWAVVLYILVTAWHARWRFADIEYARRLQSQGRFSLFNARALARRFGPAVGALLARDLQLTLRAFSSAVYVVAVLALLSVAALVAVLTTDMLPPGSEEVGWFEATWLPSVLAIKLGTVATTVSLSAMLPVLVAYELPHLWLERATGTTGLDVWQAKVWYTRVISLPAPFVSFAVGVVFGDGPAFYLIPLFVECLFLWWMVSTLVGAFSFEMPERAGLSIIMMVTVGAAGGFFAALLWPFGIMIYAQANHALGERGRERVRYYMITEAD
ncbi:MAG TPA: hypothetical protein VF131_03885 [Blastocatellia bacterium]|nr:hypothetical protein [Blastocatellia bacterium]